MDVDKTKKIYYANTIIHTYMQALVSNPPKGYEFLVNAEQKKEQFAGKMRKSPVLKWIYKNIVKNTFNTFGILNRFYSFPAPEGTDLILSTGTIVSEKKPWIMMVLDSPYSMGGNDYQVFMKNRSRIDKILSEPYCKRIIVHTEASFEIMRKHFSPAVIEKTVLMVPGIPIVSHAADKRNKKEFTLLFMGSINNPQEFLVKGGLETLETFKLLSKKHKKIKLIMKCGVPEEYKKNYTSLNIDFIEKRLSNEEINDLYQKSDVLFIPGYGYFIMAFFEAFSFGVPIVSLDTYGVSEFIRPGKNGFYVSPSPNVPLNDPDYPASVRSPHFLKAVEKIDERVIADLAEKVELLMKDKKLLNSMRAETIEIFKGNYSIEKQNEQLKKIFDEALNEPTI